MSDLYPLLLLPEFRERVWGARDLSPIYPNHQVEGQPIGEVWLTGDECRVANGPLAGQTLGDLARRYGRDLVGEAAPDPHRFPLLVKFLFPREKLSVQVHPDDETARRSGLPHGKSECWYVVSAEINAQVGLGLKPGTSRAEFEAVVRRGDRADALLNWIYIKPGEMIYNPAGTLHCIGPGSVLLEVQQNSDVTYRLYDYGRPRELHLEQGLAAIKKGLTIGRVQPHGGVLIQSPHFIVENWSLNPIYKVEKPSKTRNTQILAALEGSGVVEVEGLPPVSFSRGDVVVLPASTMEAPNLSSNDAAYTLRPQWELVCLRVRLNEKSRPEPRATLEALP